MAASRSASEVRQASAAGVAQLDPLQIVPDPFVRVQLGRVGRQPFDQEAPAADLRQQVGNLNAQLALAKAAEERAAAQPLNNKLGGF